MNRILKFICLLTILQLGICYVSCGQNRQNEAIKHINKGNQLLSSDIQMAITEFLKASSIIESTSDSLYIQANIGLAETFLLTHQLT